MNHGKSSVVALTRFYGVVMLFWGLFYATYLGPYYAHYVTLYPDPHVHSVAAAMFWTGVLHFALRVLAGLIIISKAGQIIDSLRPSETEPSFKSLIVALVKFNGFILLFYCALDVVDAVRFFSAFSRVDLSAIRSGGPEILRPCLNLLGGFLTVAWAEKIIAWLEPRRPGGVTGSGLRG